MPLPAPPARRDTALLPWCKRKRLRSCQRALARGCCPRRQAYLAWPSNTFAKAGGFSPVIKKMRGV